MSQLTKETTNMSDLKHYTPISEQEMREFLESQGFTEVKLDGIREIVYGKIVAKRTCLRVYTSVAYGQSRECGEDAIRVCLVYKRKDDTIVGIGRETRVNRIGTWKRNLQKRLDKHTDLLILCPKCEKPMKRKHNSKTQEKFWGCVEYPTCCGIKKYER